MNVIASMQHWLFLVLFIAIFVASLAALVEAVRYPGENYRAADKRTKRFWVIILSLCLLVAFLSLPLGAQAFMPRILSFATLIGAGVFWFDVRPALRAVDRRLRKRGEDYW